MDLEEARRIIGVFVNDYGNEAEGKAWDLISRALNHLPPDPAAIQKKEDFLSFSLEIRVRFYREKAYAESKVQITEELLKDYFSGPEGLATEVFKETFRRVWESREEKK